MKSVFTCGGASWNSVITLETFPDNIPQTIHNCDFDETLGNTGAGKALTLSHLGFKTIFHVLLGDDIYAQNVKRELQHPNLELVSNIDPKGTERHLNLMNAKGERISIFTNPSSDAPNINYSDLKTPIETADYVVINIANYCRNLLPICKRLNKAVWTDLHDYDHGNTYHQDFIDAADYIFLSSDNLKDYKAFMYQQIDNGKQLVVCTHAKKGASALNAEGDWFDIPTIDAYKMTNSNGAGDAFFSGFLYAHNKNYDTLTCLQYATIVAGLTIESKALCNTKVTPKLIEAEYLKYFKS